MKQLYILFVFIFPFTIIAQQGVNDLYGEWNNYLVVHSDGSSYQPVVETTLKIEPFMADSISLTLDISMYMDKTIYTYLEATSDENIWNLDGHLLELFCLQNITLTEKDSLTLSCQCACLASQCVGDYFFSKNLNTNSNTILENNVWEVYPNPVSDKLTISSSYTSISDSQILLYNNKGNLIQTIYVKSDYTFIDMAALPLGIYFIEIREEEKRTLKKILKI